MPSSLPLRRCCGATSSPSSSRRSSSSSSSSVSSRHPSPVVVLAARTAGRRTSSSLLFSSSSTSSLPRPSSRLFRCNAAARSEVSKIPSSQTEAAKDLSRGIVYTTHEGNSWEATLAPSGTTVLVDPWLVGSLTFGDTPWLYEGKKKNLPPQDLSAVCSRADALLVSQALPDHAHVPTLRALPDKSIPVVCSPAAESVVRGCGFTDVKPLPIGKSVVTAGGKLRVTATAGALVGPPWSTRENGFLIEEIVESSSSSKPLRIYYEPHCDWGEGALEGIASSSAPSSMTDEDGGVDVVVTPAVSQRLAGYPLVMGEENLVELVKILKPKALVPLVNAEFEQSGPLAAAIQQVGDGAAEAVERRLRDAGLGERTRFYSPEAPGRPLAVRID